MRLKGRTVEYRTFEDLDTYKVAREFRKKMYNLARELPESEKYNLIGQIRRASLCLTNCIAEGHGRFHYQENIQFLRQSRGSLEELIDDINICIDERYAELDRLNELKKRRIRSIEEAKRVYQVLAQMQTARQGSVTNKRRTI